MAKIKSGTFIALAQTSQAVMPGIKLAHQVKANNDWFTMVYNNLKDGGRSISPNGAYPTLIKDESRTGWVVA
jgi:hypothetical protein